MSDHFLQTAHAIGVRLCRDAVWAGERCGWLGDSMEYIGHAWTVAHRALGADLYGGTAGVALFLARLHALTGERLIRITAEGAARQAASLLAETPAPAQSGVYAGALGVAWALMQLAELLDEPEWDAQAQAALDQIAGHDVADQGIDVLGGSAGAIPALIDASRRYRRPDLLELAVRHGERLLAIARRQPHGWSWNTSGGPAQPPQYDLAGFSHGAAGIGWALLELHAAAGDDRFLQAAEQAFAYERALYSPQHQNWPDLRGLAEAGGQGAPSYMWAWCHGAPGIGLARLRAYALTGESAYRQEAAAAISSTQALLVQPGYLQQSGFSLCHGIAGNAELLIFAAETLGDESMRAAAERAGEVGIERYEQSSGPWPCGVPGGGETPSLMLGLAGIGYFYLRLHDAALTPSVLIMPPRAS